MTPKEIAAQYFLTGDARRNLEADIQAAIDEAADEANIQRIQVTQHKEALSLLEAELARVKAWRDGLAWLAFPMGVGSNVGDKLKAAVERVKAMQAVVVAAEALQEQRQFSTGADKTSADYGVGNRLADALAAIEVNHE